MVLFDIIVFEKKNIWVYKELRICSDGMNEVINLKMLC